MTRNRESRHGAFVDTSSHAGHYTKLKKTTLTIGASAFLLTEIARSFYRPYIYANDITYWVVADTIGNSLGTVDVIVTIMFGILSIVVYAKTLSCFGESSTPDDGTTRTQTKFE